VARAEQVPSVAAQVVKQVLAVPVSCSTVERPDQEVCQDLRTPERSPAVPVEPVVQVVPARQVLRAQRARLPARQLPVWMVRTAPTERMHRLSTALPPQTAERALTVSPEPQEPMQSARPVQARTQLQWAVLPAQVLPVVRVLMEPRSPMVRRARPAQVVSQATTRLMLLQQATPARMDRPELTESLLVPTVEPVEPPRWVAKPAVMVNPVEPVLRVKPVARVPRVQPDRPERLASTVCKVRPA